MMRNHGHDLEFRVLLAGLILLAAAGCTGRKAPDSGETILARIGDRTISKNEFIRRAELTIRPAWCRDNNYIHRKIVLNSLIAEKLMALEADHENPLTANKTFQAYLRGRREQAMRQWLYAKEMLEPVVPDSSDIRRTYNTAGRTYDVSYFVVNSSEAGTLRTELDQDGTRFRELFRSISGQDSLPRRTISFDQPEPDHIHTALFSEDVRKGDVLGPFETGKNQYLFLRIDGWVNSVAISDTQIKDRIEHVKDRLTRKIARDRFESYGAELMRGKTVTFNPETFHRMVNILGPDYFKTEKDKQGAFNKQFWHKDSEAMILDDPAAQLENMLDEPFLELEGRVWTVRDLQDALDAHPLVFREKRFPRSQFAEQFRLAVVDMIRDRYITEDAYRKGYDKVPEVRRNYGMWRDHLLALYHRTGFLKSIETRGEGQQELVDIYLDPYVRELREKYADRIEINTDVFEQIKLTNVDMFVIQHNVPYPVIVPEFPQLTTHNKLDYGRKMEH